MLPKIDSNTAKLFITDDTLNKFPISMISPICKVFSTFVSLKQIEYHEATAKFSVQFIFLIFDSRWPEDLEGPFGSKIVFS